MKKLFTPILALGLILCLMAPAANAWEFSMDGTFTWNYEVRGQMGTNGFFGTYDVDAGSNGGLGVGYFAPVNFWTGLRMTDGQVTPPGANAQDTVSGSDAGYNSMYMSTNMQIRMNPAVRIRGNYYIGSWDARNWGETTATYTGQANALGLLVSPEYLNMHFHGVQRSFSPGYWRTLWLTAQLPWGEIAVGKRPASWGMGLTFDGASNRASESLSLFVPYGPFRMFMGLYPSRRSSTSAYYNNSFDKNNTRNFDWSINLLYDNGPFSAGVIANFVQAHNGGEGILNTPAIRYTPANTGTPGAIRGLYSDLSEWYGNVMMKYNNGRFFLNSEVATYQANRSYLMNNTYSGLAAIATTTNGIWMNAVNAPTITNFWAGAVEGGVLAGPSKVAVLAAWLTGNDTRVDQNGLRRLVEVGVQADPYSNTSVFRPYSYLMAYSYSMGNTRGAADTREGWVSDASFYAARLDYAVAANLNVYGSFAWAERFSKSGYTWGFIYPTATATTAITYGQTTMANSTVAGANAAPSIPDTALGWEVDGGVDWKLLEGLTLRTTVAYWQPGKWFAYACQDKSVPGWGADNTALNWGTRPGKTIDPIFGVDFKLEGTF